MIGDQIQRIDPLFLHVRAHVPQQRAGNAPAPPILLCVYSTHIGSQILPVMKIILDHSHAADDPLPVQRHIPLGNRALLLQALLHALHIRLQWDPPFFMEPPGRLFLKFRPVCEPHDLIVHFSSS